MRVYSYEEFLQSIEISYDNWDDFGARILIVLWVYGRIFDLIDLGWEKY